jgi:hypothetical protein
MSLGNVEPERVSSHITVFIRWELDLSLIHVEQQEFSYLNIQCASPCVKANIPENIAAVLAS